MQRMQQTLISLYRTLMARPSLYKLNLHLYKLSLRGLGVLNSEGPQATGERWLTQKLAASNQVKTIVDVGANTDVFGAAELPNAQIYAFEPHPKTAQKLRAQVATNHWHHVAIHEMALADAPGKLKLWDFANDAEKKHLQPTSTLSSLSKTVIEQLHQQKAQSFPVKVETLDRMAAKLKLNTIDLLKIDTEGYELAVLRGAQQLLHANKIRLIQFEFNEMNVYTKSFFIDFVTLLPNFKLYRLLPNGLLPLGQYRPLTHEIFGFQNIVAVLKQAENPIHKRFSN